MANDLRATRPKRPEAPPRPGSPGAGGGRACGPCDLCCRLPSIDWPEYPELHKPAGAYCKHCIPGGGGCAIHPDRPIHCASFQCLWLMGFGPDELRPDRIGGFMDAVDAGRMFLVTDRDRPDPRTIPAVARFIAEWTAKRRSRLVVYLEGKEVDERRGGAAGPRH